VSTPVAKPVNDTTNTGGDVATNYAIGGAQSRWVELFLGRGAAGAGPRHSRHEWAQLTAAVQAIDITYSSLDRGGEAWCARVCAAYEQQMRARPAANAAQPWWRADGAAIRTWLTSPLPVAGSEPHMLIDAHGWRSTFDPQYMPSLDELSLFAQWAQHCGVFGDPTCHVDLMRVVVDGWLREDLCTVVLSGPGPTRVSTTVYVTELVLGAYSATDRIVAFLSRLGAVGRHLAAPPPRSGPVHHHQPPAPPVAANQGHHPGGNAFRGPQRAGAHTASSGRPPSAWPPPTPARTLWQRIRHR
jgi:hypothetical protein